ncbi:hypothetical protein JKP88DRAFT_285795 [Tribonema minus]|uniref:Uncharacterized protein n=1 Tax=Tribonema minus TaxID=303371 RepID=A0A836CL83_9STRA|nr:hypothetical protein JKP88DRAFT_285795 [Tribonema minus]
MEVTEFIFENQRKAPFKGWHGKLRPRDPPPFCQTDGLNGSVALPKAAPPPLGWVWTTPGGAWSADVEWNAGGGGCDPEAGWAYAGEFGEGVWHFPPADRDAVRRRRHR